MAAADPTPPDNGSPDGRRRRPFGLAKATIVPALAVASIVITVTIAGGEEPKASPLESSSAAALSEMAEAGSARASRGPGRRRRRPATPVSISIPVAGVKAAVEPVSIERDGALRVPDIGRAGWYDGGPRPGEPGRAVIVGHLDTNRGPGLFAAVPTLKAGATVAVTDTQNEVHRYRVIGGAQVRKDRFPTDSVYGRTTHPVLVLVTCGGPFVEGRGYRDNVLLYARAV